MDQEKSNDGDELQYVIQPTKNEQSKRPEYRHDVIRFTSSARSSSVPLQHIETLDAPICCFVDVSTFLMLFLLKSRPQPLANTIQHDVLLQKNLDLVGLSVVSRVLLDLFLLMLILQPFEFCVFVTGLVRTLRPNAKALVPCWTNGRSKQSLSLDTDVS